MGGAQLYVCRNSIFGLTGNQLGTAMLRALDAHSLSLGRMIAIIICIHKSFHHNLGLV
jgi:hypothetical protein